MENSQRCFIALEIPREIQHALVKVVDMAQLVPANGFRPVRSGMIHVTLKFLGDTPLSVISQIKEELSKIAESQKPFSLKVQGLGAFASWDHPRTIWAGLVSPPELLNLSVRINQLSDQFGFPGDNRPFSPHLTIARVSEGANFTRVKQCIEVLRQNSNMTFGEVAVTQVVLFESALQHGGSVYTPLSKHGFGRTKV